MTALLNEEVNKELRKDKEIEVISDDLLYQEAVLEKIKENKNVDFLLLNENLPGEKIEDFIQKLSEIKIIVFTEKSGKNQIFYESKNIYNVFTNGEKSVDEIIKIIKEENYIEKLENEIEILKKAISEKKEAKKINIKKYIKIKNINKNKEKENKIISVIGNSKIEKAIFSINISKELEQKNLKYCLINLDFFNQDIELFKEKNLKIINIENIILKNGEKIERYELEKKLENLKKQYQYIIVNTSSECFFDFTKIILEKSAKIFFTVENTIDDIKKSRKLLDIYIKIWKIKKEKIKIIISETITKKNIQKNIKEIIYKTKILKKLDVKKEKMESSQQKPKLKYIRKQYQKLIREI